MNRLSYINLFIAAGILLSFMAGPLICLTNAGDVFYYCKDKESPCVSLQKDGCSGCPKDIKELDVNLPNLMGVLKDVTKSFRSYSKKANQPKLTEIAGSIAVLAQLIATQTPHKGSDKLDEFKSLASELQQQAANVATQASAGSKNSFSAYKKYENLCSMCHTSFR